MQQIPEEHRDFEWHLDRRLFEGSDVTLYSHTELVNSVAFSPDGTRIVSRGVSNRRMIRDVQAGKSLDEDELPETAEKANRSLDGRWLAGPVSDDVVLVDLQCSSNPLEQARRLQSARIEDGWHQEQARSAERNKDWFAAMLHRAWILRANPRLAGSSDDFQSAHEKWLASTDQATRPPLPLIVRQMPENGDPLAPEERERIREKQERRAILRELNQRPCAQVKVPGPEQPRGVADIE